MDPSDRFCSPFYPTLEFRYLNNTYDTPHYLAFFVLIVEYSFVLTSSFARANVK